MTGAGAAIGKKRSARQKKRTGLVRQAVKQQKDAQKIYAV
jgi:hypothetical protein